MNDLLEIKVEGPPLCQFSTDQAIDLWFGDGGIERRWKKCTSSRKKRAQPQEGCSSAILVESESDNETMWINGLISLKMRSDECIITLSS